MRQCFFYLIFLGLLFACDTASNIKDPGKNYFLKYFGSEGSQTARDLIVNSDGTFYILGNSTQTSSSQTKVYIAHVDAYGNVINQITYGLFPMDARDFEIAGGNLVVVANRQAATNDVLLKRFSLDLKTAIDSVVLSAGIGLNTIANSLTPLSNGGFIIEGYQYQVSPGSSNEVHLRVDNSMNVYTKYGWSPNLVPPQPGASYFGVRTIVSQLDSLITFGYTTASYNGSSNIRFWYYPLAYNSGAYSNNDLDSEKKDRNAYNNILTNVIPAAAGGYLLTGVSYTNQNYLLRVAITTGVLDFTSDILQDSLLLSLGNSLNPYVTASSSPLYNFILANTYNKTSNGKSDIILLKVGNDLRSIWGPVQFGADGEDTAAAVAELPDGHIMVLGTMQLGNPPAQFKIVLMKLNASGQLSN